MFRFSRFGRRLGFAAAISLLIISAAGNALCGTKKYDKSATEKKRDSVSLHQSDPAATQKANDALLKEFHLSPSFAELYRKTDAAKLSDHIYQATPPAPGRLLQPATGLSPAAQGAEFRGPKLPLDAAPRSLRSPKVQLSNTLGADPYPVDAVRELTTRNGMSYLSGTILRPIDVTKENLGPGSTLIIRGEDPAPEVRNWLDSEDVVVVRSTARSPNQDPQIIARVAERLKKPLSLNNVKIFNGLPNANPDFDSFREFSAMGLPAQQFRHWGRLGKDVQKKLDEVPVSSQAATKSDIQKELVEGTSDVLILVAHNDNGTLRFQPQRRTGNILGIEQVNEDTLSSSELPSRETAPQRVIILISCEAGGVNGSAASVAETLIRNKLADVVISSPGPVNASDFPTILDDIAAQKTPLIKLLRRYPYHYTPIVFRLPSGKKLADG